MKFFDGMAAHTMAVRLFVLERGGLTFDVEIIDILSMANRKPAYLRINSRGQLPALQTDSGLILTEIPAICEYLDEIATGGTSLYGTTALERAETRMRLRQIDLEVITPLFSWWRNDPATIDFYLGNHIPIPEARVLQKVQISRALNQIDLELEGKEWLCGSRFSAADIHFYGLAKLLIMTQAEWIVDKKRTNLVKYFERMEARPTAQKAMELFPNHVSL